MCAVLNCVGNVQETLIGVSETVVVGSVVSKLILVSDPMPDTATHYRQKSRNGTVTQNPCPHNLTTPTYGAIIDVRQLCFIHIDRLNECSLLVGITAFENMIMLSLSSELFDSYLGVSTIMSLYVTSTSSSFTSYSSHSNTLCHSRALNTYLSLIDMSTSWH